MLRCKNNNKHKQTVAHAILSPYGRHLLMHNCKYTGRPRECSAGECYNCSNTQDQTFHNPAVLCFALTWFLLLLLLLLLLLFSPLLLFDVNKYINIWLWGSKNLIQVCVVNSTWPTLQPVNPKEHSRIHSECKRESEREREECMERSRVCVGGFFLFFLLLLLLVVVLVVGGVVLKIKIKRRSHSN